jgi:protein TonB
MLASDSILVTRVEMEPAAVSDSAWQSHAPVSRKRVTVNQVKGPWMRRFAANFIPPGATLRTELCPPPRGTAGLAKPWMLSALWINKDGRGQVFVDLSTGCSIAGLVGSGPVALDVGAHADSLLALFQQALFADSALATIKPGSLGEGSRSQEPAAVRTPPQPIDRVAPVYPDSARAAGIEGTVVVKTLVGSDGRVMRVDVETGVPGLDAAALTAVKQWRFKPATVDGKPRAMTVGVPVKFSLSPGEPTKKH